MQQLFKRLRCEDGQALVELAFVIPIVLLFLFAIIDFGLALNQQNQDTNMANIGVRAAAVYSGSGGMTCSGKSYSTLATWLSCESKSDGGPTLTSVCIYDTRSSAKGTTYSTGDPIEVTVGSSFSWMKLLTGQIHNLSSSIGANATMRLETSQISSETPSSSASPAVLPFFVNPSGC